MRVASVYMRNFKRFTELTIGDIPQTARVVVVAGQNGCGKSSLLDAFIQWYRQHTGFGRDEDQSYTLKQIEQESSKQTVQVSLHDKVTLEKGDLYLRTAYRNDPDFHVNTLSQQQSPRETLSAQRSIYNDQTVSNNYARLLHESISSVYDTRNDTKSVVELRAELIGALQQSLKNVFGTLQLNNITNPLGDGTFYFNKGNAKKYHYKNLSGGEKAAFDLLLDLHVKRRFHQNAIYFIDEIDTHMHTRLQGQLFKEIAALIPDSSQLWVTTHSLGVLREAQRMNQEKAGSISVIEFDSVDPDAPCSLTPSNLDRVTWEKLLSIALDDLSIRIVPDFIVVCEGSSQGGRRKDYDAEILNRILKSHTDKSVLFVSGGGSSQVTASGVAAGALLGKVLPATKIFSLRDRDDLSDSEIADIEKQKTIVLPRRNLESYLMDDEVLTCLAAKHNKANKSTEILEAKKKALEQSHARSNAIDDVKSASGDIYVAVKRILSMSQCGNDKDSFMRDTLVPLIHPEMQVAKELAQAILGRLV